MRKKLCSLRLFVYFVAFASFSTNTQASDGQKAGLTKREQVIENAFRLLEMGTISYAYGGSKVGSSSQCRICAECLSKRKPAPKRQLQICPPCQECSLDCSNFISQVFQAAGLQAPYLTTSMMRSLSPNELLNSFKWVDIGKNQRRALPGDIVVYEGHVIMIVEVKNKGTGDIIHATSGRIIRGPMHGIQLARNVDFSNFKGPIRRILRHKTLASELAEVAKKKIGVRRVPTR